GGDALEVAVDDADGLRALEGDAVDVALGDGRKVDRVEDLAALLRGEGGSGEHVDGHRACSRNARARRPYWQLGTTPRASRPGITTRATGMPNSGLVRSTTITRSTPTA